jgi:hypothetical protein
MNTMIAFLVAGATTATPSAPLQSAVADYGEVKAGPILTHAFKLTNSGNGPLTLIGAESGCGCLRAEVSKNQLQSGESAELTVVVNTLTQPEGQNTWRVTLRYEFDPIPAAMRPGELTPPRIPVRYTAEFRIVAKLVRDVTVTPPSVAISTTGEASQTLFVADRRDRPLTVTGAVSNSPYLVMKIGAVEIRDGRRVQTIDLKLSADAPVGHMDATVILTSDDPAYRELRVPVRVSKRAAGTVAISPDSVTLRFAAMQAEASQVVVLRSLSGGSVHIARAECDDQDVGLKWSTGTSPVATVRITLPARPAGQSEVRVLLAEPAGHVVTVPLSWTND